MPKATNAINGKAFEFACLSSLLEYMKSTGKSVSVETGKPYQTAQRAYDSRDQKMRDNMDESAKTAVKLLLPLEPKLADGKGNLLLQISPDSRAKGVEGDVRDVICIRGDENWTIGISCKHNHEGLRHPRVTEGKDFGKDWMDIPCSKDFMDEITPVTDSLINNDKNGIKWSEIKDKWDSYYIPILSAYKNEIERMCKNDPSVPKKLLSYFFGANDFYKVIMKERARTTTVEGFNMHGTLNSPCGKKKAMTKVPVMKMPTRLLDTAFKPRSKTTIIITFDNGWSISMRLHNKDRIAKPTSLAWDINLVGLPPSTYVNTHSWDE